MSGTYNPKDIRQSIVQNAEAFAQDCKTQHHTTNEAYVKTVFLAGFCVAFVRMRAINELPISLEQASDMVRKVLEQAQAFLDAQVAGAGQTPCSKN